MDQFVVCFIFCIMFHNFFFLHSSDCFIDLVAVFHFYAVKCFDGFDGFRVAWALTSNHFLIAALGMGLCVALIALVQLPNLKVSTLLLTGLLIYDVFWVCAFVRLTNNTGSWFVSTFVFNYGGTTCNWYYRLYYNMLRISACHTWNPSYIVLIGLMLKWENFYILGVTEKRSRCFEWTMSVFTQEFWS